MFMRIIFILFLIFLLHCLPVSAKTAAQKDTLFQVSTIDALLQGLYDGVVTIGELKQHGDFGIGTFNAVDGEMVVLDGKVYQVRADGKACLANDQAKTPFAAVTPFEIDKRSVLDRSVDLKGLAAYLDSLLPTKNIFYAVKITGKFDYIKTRSVPKQNHPYRPLAEVLKNQPTFEFNDVEGTIVGLRCPDYVSGLNVPAYHFHFLTKGRKAGGHLLECRLKNAQIALDYTPNFDLTLLNTPAFYNARFGEDQSSTIWKNRRPACR
jgi:acetolactate decarboxylase